MLTGSPQLNQILYCLYRLTQNESTIQVASSGFTHFNIVYRDAKASILILELQPFLHNEYLFMTDHRMYYKCDVVLIIKPHH